jgi:hypothetical protein
MIWQVLLFGLANRSFFLSLAILLFLLGGLLIIAAKISAPFIYTLF